MTTKQLLHPPEPMSFTFHVGCGRRHDYDGKHGIDCPDDIEVVMAEPHYGAWRVEEAFDDNRQGTSTAEERESEAFMAGRAAAAAGFGRTPPGDGRSKQAKEWVAGFDSVKGAELEE